MGFAYLFLAMLILIVDENTLETGLDEAYASFNESASAFLADNAGLDSSGPASKLVITYWFVFNVLINFDIGVCLLIFYDCIFQVLKFVIALWCGSIGALFTFPGLRLAKMQWDVLSYTENPIWIMLLHFSYISPMFLTMMWIKPLSRDYLTQRVFKGMTEPM